MNKLSSAKARSAVFCAVTLALLVFASGCSTLDKGMKRPSTGGKQPAVVIAISEDGKVAVFNRDGQQFTDCRLCNAESCRVNPNDKEAIARLRAAGFCTSLVNATTVEPFVNIAIQKTRVNPFCWTAFFGGYEAESCICGPGEVDPRCVATVPAPQ